MMEETGVRWHEWEPGALSRASVEGKLIFLDIGATWCHWCHVLDRTSLSDPRVVRVLNEDYIPVRVDTDRRPDINERYNQGGWPTTAVLMPDGRLLTGATYLPPEALAGLLEKCRDFYRRDRDRVDAYLRNAEDPAPSPAAERSDAPESPRPEDLPLVKHAVLAQYDPAHPGFFREPKFPVTDILAFLRDAWIAEGNRETGETFLRVLRRMADSELLDRVEGGFFRYATRRDWTVPHYEKMLAENAELLALYAAAYERTAEESYASAGRDILRFLLMKLHDPATGAFFGSQDADETYYPLPEEERALRVAPSVDRTIFAEYNGKAVSGLVSAHRAFGVPNVEGGDSLLARAERLGRFLRERMTILDAGVVRYLASPGAEEKVPRRLLADLAAVATGYLDLHDASGKGEYLRWAEEILSDAVSHMYRPDASGFPDRLPAAGDFGVLSQPLYPFAPNAQVACALLRCARATGREDLFAVGVRTLCGLSAEFDQRGAFGAPYGSALLLYWKGKAGTACLPGDPTCAPAL
ncbi:MAG: hypothetical protein A2Z26_07935 [Deltaproteobacteria bacterium RBG_16_66_15]|nr:MAG: hypothetical protein A2X90_02395 [Deltaproteobacteria bacterium GWA2_65_63]OGP28380.1 MAG: hypothetical protein A2X91_09115 [Deltaproteobacteria bacterium GWB2_65_81]OGP36020.1 MAG: hypothetical protein A2X98_06685 [Deltaproteobacteria bacterium GWC2_66_88]OGP78362.1 MAG: hypothetical protein A2Z26_07935 [Deltaproteobacteria bacterium RBG_16_66_15]